MSDTVREKIEYIAKQSGLPMWSGQVTEALLMLFRQTVDIEIQNLREHGENTEYQHALSDVYDAIVEKFK